VIQVELSGGALLYYEFVVLLLGGFGVTVGTKVVSRVRMRGMNKFWESL
jgi:hypothetical protein